MESVKPVKSFVLIMLATGLVVFFQNCGVSQTTGLLGSSKTQSSIADKVVTNAPFAYDLVADTISYNSCVGENLNALGIPGLKIGVNEGFVDSAGSGAVKAGLKLNTEFLQYVGQHIQPSYPASVITPAQIQNVISNSPINKDTYIQFAVRKKNDLSVVKDLIQAPAATTPIAPRDGVVNFTALASGDILTELTKNIKFAEAGVILSEGPRLYNLGDVTVPTPIVASFGYNNIADETFPKVGAVLDTENLGYGERYAETVRSAFTSSDVTKKYLLTITYGPSAATSDLGLSTPKRLDPLKKGNAHGRSYALQFGFPANAVRSGWKNTALLQVQESNLSDGSVVSGVSWNCNSYVIMKQTQWNNSKYTQPACSPITANDLLDVNTMKNVKGIRRHYTEESWNIGYFYKAGDLYDPTAVDEPLKRRSLPICLVPKAPSTTECYLPTDTVTPGTDVGVNYDPLTECYLYNRFGTAYSDFIDVVKSHGRCAQYASVCTR